MPEVNLATGEAIAEKAIGCRDWRAIAIAGIGWSRAGKCALRGLVFLNVAGLLIFAVALRCRDLANLPGINGDEAWYGVQAELFLQGQPISWRTPSGNLLNPLFFGPQLALHEVFDPSFVVLRATAVISGLLALAINFWLCRRVFGRRPAIISTTLLAVLPIDIAYSRIAWDASQSLLATLPCVYLPLWAMVDGRLKVRLSIATIAALLIAVVVHPTNVFIAPVAVACLAYAWRGTFALRIRRAAAGCVALVGLTVVAISCAAVVWFPDTVARITNPQQYTAFLANLGRLFSGATVYEYLSGAVRPAVSAGASGSGLRWDCVPYDAAAWLVGGWLAWGFAREPRRKRPELFCLAIGWGASLFGFFLVAGPGGLAPNFERYAIWTIAPAAVVASLAIEAWQTRHGCPAVLSTAAALALGWLLLFGFQTNCLDFIRQTGGRSHRTFRTAAIEPKQAALSAILAERQSKQPVRIVTSEWWIYWPMRYLSFSTRPGGGNPSLVSVEMRTIADEQAIWSEVALPQAGRIWFVEFTGTLACSTLRKTAGATRHLLSETRINDFAGRPIVSLFTPSARSGSGIRENSAGPAW